MPKTAKRFNITKTFVDSVVPPDRGEKFFRDANLQGFGLRVGTGSKSYFVEGRVRGTGINRRITLAKHGKLTPELARRQAKRIIADMAVGIDPVIAEADSKATSVTLNEVRNRYLATRNLSPSGRKTYTTLLDRCLGDWLNKPLKSITKDMVELRHQELTRPTRFGTDGKCQANMAMSALNTLFNFAMDEYETAHGSRSSRAIPSGGFRKIGVGM